MSELFFTKVAEFHRGVFQCIFQKISQNAFSTGQQSTATLELKKEGVKIGHQFA